MTIPLIRQTSLFNSLFTTTLEACKKGSKEIANSILMNVIFYYNDASQDLEKALDALENEPHIALEHDTEEFHDAMMKSEDFLEKMLNTAKEHKNDSEIFEEYYKAIDKLYTLTVKLGMEISTVAIKLRHESELAS